MTNSAKRDFIVQTKLRMPLPGRALVLTGHDLPTGPDDTVFELRKDRLLVVSETDDETTIAAAAVAAAGASAAGSASGPVPEFRSIDLRQSSPSVPAAKANKKF